MDEQQRQAIEERARRLWTEAGSPPGREQEYRTRAVAELAGGKEALLQSSVDQAVPTDEQLPERARENPLSEHVADIARGARPGPGDSTLEGGDEVEQRGSHRRD
jgi:transposase